MLFFSHQVSDFCGDSNNRIIQSQSTLDNTISDKIHVFYEFPSELVTSLSATTHGSKTVLILGTNTGRFIKVWAGIILKIRLKDILLCCITFLNNLCVIIKNNK